MRPIDLTGQRFERLTVVRMVGRKGVSLWECRCDCGNVTNVWYPALTTGKTKSCGCFHRDRVSTKKGESKTRLYNIWYMMIHRCESPSDGHYADYGGRGIKVCEAWHDYFVFKAWAQEHGYQDNLSIERVDVNGNYEPDNCKWIPLKEQPRNRRSTVYLEYKGKTYTMAELADKAGMSRQAFHYRITHGWSVEHAVELPLDNDYAKKKSRLPVCETEKAAKKKCAGVSVTPQKGKVNYDAVSNQ